MSNLERFALSLVVSLDIHLIGYIIWNFINT
jgi:hypothetical protein